MPVNNCCCSNNDPCNEGCCQTLRFIYSPLPEVYDLTDGVITTDGAGDPTYVAETSGEVLYCPVPLDHNDSIWRESDGRWYTTFHLGLTPTTITFRSIDTDYDCPPLSEADLLSPLWEFVSSTNAITYMVLQVSCCDEVEDDPPETIALSGLIGTMIGNGLTFTRVSSTSYPTWDETLTYDMGDDKWYAPNNVSIPMGDGMYYVELDASHRLYFEAIGSRWRVVLWGTVIAEGWFCDWTKAIPMKFAIMNGEQSFPAYLFPGVP